MLAPLTPSLFPSGNRLESLPQAFTFDAPPFIAAHFSSHPILPSGKRFPKSTPRTICRASVDDAERTLWLPQTSPLQILGLTEDCCEEDIKAAFRRKVKEFHPDVYKGSENAVAIMQRLIQAYELLMKQVDRGASKRKSSDPFDDPECEAEDVFVNELNCIGRGCPYSCVERAPGVFKFAPEMDCARAVKQGRPGDYAVQLAVGQCPRNCIFYVTPLQRERLERVMERALEGTWYSNEVALLEDLLARAKYENGRFTPSKRKVNISTQWVDWY